MLAKQLSVTQPAISMRLCAMEKVQKIRKWFSHELMIGIWSGPKNTCEILLVKQKRKLFFYWIVTSDKK